MKDQARKLILGVIINAMSISLASYWLDKFNYDGWVMLSIIAVLFTIVSIVLRPVIKILSLPLFFLGPIIFFLADAAILWGIDQLTTGFAVGDWQTLGIAAAIIGVINYLAHWIV
ncbi:phage holin family protein [Candidatus Microgenomates bacterium]|nr:phage holin family protein [Candidatus Microgenomates bacterium]